MFVGGSGSRGDASLLRVGWGSENLYRFLCCDDVRSGDTPVSVSVDHLRIPRVGSFEALGA